MINIKKYLLKSYDYPSCWALVTDICVNEYNVNLDHILNPENSKNIKSLQEAFLLFILKNKSYKIQSNPVQGAIVLMYKNYVDKPDHCGIYYQNQILHASTTMPMLEPISNMKDRYNKLEYGIIKHDY